jgi:hypothetical protein
VALTKDELISLLQNEVRILTIFGPFHLRTMVAGFKL